MDFDTAERPSSRLIRQSEINFDTTERPSSRLLKQPETDFVIEERPSSRFLRPSKTDFKFNATERPSSRLLRQSEFDFNTMEKPSSRLLRPSLMEYDNAERPSARLLRRSEIDFNTTERPSSRFLGDSRSGNLRVKDGAKPKAKHEEITIRPEDILVRDARGRCDDLKTINDDIFRGVNYSRQYYDDVTSEGSFSRVAHVGDQLAGAISCFIVTKGKDKYKRKEINISTIGVFKHFRRKGVGTKLIDSVIEAAIDDPFATKVLLNVHSNDSSAMNFYKKLGFEVVNQMQLPYGSAWVMERTLRTIGLERR